VKETVELARADNEQTRKIIQSDFMMGTFSESPAGVLHCAAQRNTTFSAVNKFGRLDESDPLLRFVNYLMNPMLELGQWSSTAIETGPTAIHDDLLLRIFIKVMIHLKRAGRHE
jgi:hypothetical protein